jgi:hypothetical protein
MVFEDLIYQLFVLSQVAGVFIGFIAVTSALSVKDDSDKDLSDLMALTLTVLTSIHLIFAAFAPVALANFDISHEVVWRMAALMSLVLDIVIVVWMVRMPGFANIPKRRKLTAISHWIGEAALLLCLLLVIFNVFPGHNGAIYLLASLTLLFQVISAMMSLVIDGALSKLESDKWLLGLSLLKICF